MTTTLGQRRSASPAALRRRAGAFTLIEAVVSLAIVSLLLVSALGAVAGVTRARGARADHGMGVVLAQDLMSEILAAYYEEPEDPPGFGPEGGESTLVRADWDDVDDFDAWTASPPQDRDGTVLTEFAGWSRSVTVTPADPGTLAVLAPGAADTGVRMITVQVTSPIGRTTSMTALRADLTGLEQPPTLDTAYTERVGIVLQLGSDPATRMRSGVSILNHRPPREPVPEAGGE